MAKTIKSRKRSMSYLDTKYAYYAISLILFLLMYLNTNSSIFNILYRNQYYSKKNVPETQQQPRKLLIKSHRRDHIRERQRHWGVMMSIWWSDGWWNDGRVYQDLALTQYRSWCHPKWMLIIHSPAKMTLLSSSKGQTLIIIIITPVPFSFSCLSLSRSLVVTS